MFVKTNYKQKYNGKFEENLKTKILSKKLIKYIRN